jgi:hypothetical protein
VRNGRHNEITFEVRAMANLVLLTLGNGEVIRCVDLADARQKAIACSDGEGKISVKITPEGGGPIMSLTRLSPF